MIFIKIILLLFASICPQFALTPSVVSASSYTYPQLTAEAAVLIDAKTGQVLYGKNLNVRQYPASITKVMTGLLALEKGNLTDIMTMSREAVFSIGRNSSHVALDADEELTLEQALYAIAIASANDASNGIAEHISGSMESFAQLMTEKARQIGAENTNFVNAHGLPDDNHYTTAYDMAIIMMEAIKTTGFTDFFGETFYEMAPTNQQLEPRYFHSRNYLVNGNAQYPGITAGKSGWTSQANHTLITAAEQGDRQLIAVVMNNQSRTNNYQDTIKLFDYGFDDFYKVTPDIADLKSLRPDLNLGTIEKDSLARLLHKSLSPDDLVKRYEFLELNDETVQVAVTLLLSQPQMMMYDQLEPVIFDVAKIKEAVPEVEMSAYTGNNSFFNINYLLPAGAGFIFLLSVGFVFLKKKIAVNRNRINIYHKYRY